MPLLLPQPNMAYHANLSPFGRHGGLRDPPFNSGPGDSISFSSRSTGINRDLGLSPTWDASDVARVYNNRIPSPAKDQFLQKHGETTAISERHEFSDAWSFYTNNNRVSLSPLSYDQHSHQPTHLMARPTGAQLAQAPGNGRWDIPVSARSDTLTPKAIISGETTMFPERLKRRNTDNTRSTGRYLSQRRPGNRDEFDGPTQLLDMPAPVILETQEEDLPLLPTTLDVQEQDQLLYDVNNRLSKCAFDFVAKYQFPIPVETDKKQVRGPQDREWTEWVYLLKRLATKRRIPARVLYDGQIKQFVTVLENALETRHVARNQNRPLKDDRNILQFISAGTQVAKILKDAPAMEYFDWLYVQTEKYIHERRMQREKFAFENVR